MTCVAIRIFLEVLIHPNILLTLKRLLSPSTSNNIIHFPVFAC